MVKKLVCMLVAVSTVFVNGVALCEPEGDEEDFLQDLEPILLSAGGASRLYFVKPCTTGVNPVGFPSLTLQPPSQGKKGIAAVEDALRGNEDIVITTSPLGIVHITVGKVPSSLLETKIARLKLTPRQRYNPIHAVVAIQEAKEIAQARGRLGLQVAPYIVEGFLVEPAKGLPHLPPAFTNVTMDEALDMVARTFKGLVIYSECVGPNNARFLKVDFAFIRQRSIQH